MLTAITRAVSPGIVTCELTFVARQPIELARAEAQHRAYQELLEKLGARVISLPAEAALPDSMFVEDPAIVLDELAIIFPLGTESRRAEGASIAQALAKFRKIACVDLPGTVEGGDVFRVGQRLFAGVSSRTNAEGIRQLASIVAPYGYEVVSVAVTGCLHLKSAATALNSETVLLNPAWIAPRVFDNYDRVEIDPAETAAANVVSVNGRLIAGAAFSRTCERLERRGFSVVGVDARELARAEGALTCCSLLVS